MVNALRIHSEIANLASSFTVQILLVSKIRRVFIVFFSKFFDLKKLTELETIKSQSYFGMFAWYTMGLQFCRLNITASLSLVSRSGFLCFFFQKT